jgi:hypothetical protein
MKRVISRSNAIGRGLLTLGAVSIVCLSFGGRSGPVKKDPSACQSASISNGRIAFPSRALKTSAHRHPHGANRTIDLVTLPPERFSSPNSATERSDVARSGSLDLARCCYQIRGRAPPATF